MRSMINPIRILHFAGVINRYDFIDTVIRFADPKQFHMMACTFTEESNIDSTKYVQGGIPHFSLDTHNRKDYLRAILRLAKILRQERVDILHAHHYDEGIIGVLAALLARVPAVIIGRQYYNEIYLLTNGMKQRALLTLEQFVNRRAKGIVVPSTPVRELLVKQAIVSDKVWVVPYGFDFKADRYKIPTEKEQRLIREGLGLNGHFVVGNFGRHHELKGQDYLLRAFARFVKYYPDARLLMVGDGPFHDKLRTLAGQLGFDDNDSPFVIFTGWRKDAQQLMAAVDIVAHPSIHESFSQLMVEAMAKAKPLIITNVAGPCDHIEHLRTGYIVPERSSDALYEALCWVRQHQEEARQMGKRAREYVLKNLDIRSLIHTFEERYISIAERGNGSL